MNDKFSFDAGSIDYVAIHREANRMRSEALAQMMSNAIRSFSRTLQRVFHNGAHGTPARG